ncbi:potassium channel family protein [Streptacidiphilus sp. N1-3]|uniref:Potassium channel family protein n=1 Tax=Streptacidiphilus alkalitolerans TaxID=3342712 RepID=A0ABV6X8Y8_9ACTN
MDSPRFKMPGSGLRGQWVWLPVLGGVALLLAGYFTLPLEIFGPHRPALSWVVFLCALALLAALLLRQVRLVLAESDRGRPGVVIVLLICLSLVVFATAYLGLSRDGQFSGLDTRTDALYFTVVTLATIGYGDIHPSGQEARLVVVVQIAYNFVFLAAGASALTRRVRGRAATRIRSRGGQAHGGHSRPPGDDGPLSDPPARFRP